MKCAKAYREDKSRFPTRPWISKLVNLCFRIAQHESVQAGRLPSDGLHTTVQLHKRMLSRVSGPMMCANCRLGSSVTWLVATDLPSQQSEGPPAPEKEITDSRSRSNSMSLTVSSVHCVVFAFSLVQYRTCSVPDDRPGKYSAICFQVRALFSFRSTNKESSSGVNFNFGPRGRGAGDGIPPSPPPPFPPAPPGEFPTNPGLTGPRFDPPISRAVRGILLGGG